MKVYHQTGFREVWNIDSYKKGFGDGIIFSPLNINTDKLLDLPKKLKITGFLDPQLYLLNEAKGKLNTHPYFPNNIADGFSTHYMEDYNLDLAQVCVDYQLKNNFDYLVIPSRYYEENPSNFFKDSTDYFVNPFCEYIQDQNTGKKILLSVILKGVMLTDPGKRHETLNWITRHQDIDGIYLIIENNSLSKQIKDYDLLLNTLFFIQKLKENDLEVHIGYCNTEALLYSIAMPDSITMGGYENLRSFNIIRFRDIDNSAQRHPNARLYSTKLLQWIDCDFIKGMKQMVTNYETYFDESEHLPLMFDPSYKWHFTKPDLYKHYFKVFYEQIHTLPSSQDDRIKEVQKQIVDARLNFALIESKMVLDSDSNGSHLPHWENVIKTFNKQ